VAFKHARSQEAYDRFSAATNLPLTLLAVLWLPTLVFPLVMNLPASVVRTFDLIDLVIWLLYGAAVVLANALTRVRGILTHRGLHFVLMGVTGIVVVASGCGAGL
jgi:hypothetical protein